jgi:ferredoxin
VTSPELVIEIDRERCMGSGTCTFHAPNTFDIDDEMKAVLLPGPIDTLDNVRAAIQGCPTQALRLADETTEDSLLSDEGDAGATG